MSFLEENAAERAASEARSVSIIIPTFNGAARIGFCLDALLTQIDGRSTEILVVDDGSTDKTVDFLRQVYPTVRLISQPNSGPATARNRGASDARGSLLFFTDDDCVPTAGWFDAMLSPFDDEAVIGVKGAYLTHQRSLAARFVQIEYEDKYRLMAQQPSIDFIDTYSAGFRRERFLEMGGYDTSFPVACAEDVELSYRMSARQWLMKFIPSAVVYHTHPSTFSSYFKKKYKFAYWRVLAVRKNPAKGVRDSHTPQVMKLQLLFAPALVAAIVVDSVRRSDAPVLTLMVIGVFFLSTLPFTMRALKKDATVGLLSPFLLAARACAQGLGVALGMVHALRQPSPSMSPGR